MIISKEKKTMNFNLSFVSFYVSFTTLLQRLIE